MEDVNRLKNACRKEGNKQMVDGAIRLKSVDHI